MSKFIVMTRGRTGSTAIIDELNQLDSVFSGQELFTSLEYNQWSSEVISQDYEAIEPFSYWLGKDNLMRSLIRRLRGDKHLISKYLRFAEDKAKELNKNSFGFKIISHHLVGNVPLVEVLSKQSYSVIYLTRNLSRQIISGLLARQRGVYNSKNFHDTGRYSIDVEEFESLVKWEQYAVNSDREFIKDHGFRSIDITYEDFVTNRELFYKGLLDFLKVPFELPVKSSYSVMITDLEHSIINFNDIKDAANKIGMPIV
ncbi:MAG: hypothetical protein AB9Q19_05115 [Candidatus Reddybacter sp.]